MTTEDDPTRPKPQTMDELLDLSAEEFRQVEAYMYRGSLSPKRLIKDMIRLLDRDLSWQGREDSMSLRGLWYSGVKTALQHAFPEKWDDPDFDANRRYAQYLSDYLSEMVKDGEVSYKGLNIVDDSRQREIHNGSIEDDKILFVEKEAAYRRLEPIADVFELSLVSGGGWEATALIEDLANNLDDSQEYQLFILSDFDPTGYRIAEDFEQRSQTLGVNITDVQRIGIEPHQVSARVREQERFEVPVENDYDEEWLSRHGIDDQYGLEIEAIGDRGEGGRPLRKIVVEAMRPHLRLRKRIKRDTRRAVEHVAYWAVSRLIDDLTQQLERELMRYATDRLDELEPVESCEQFAGDSVHASIDLAKMEQSSHHLLPDPLTGDDYCENAIEAPTGAGGTLNVTSVPYARERNEMKQEIRNAIADGEIEIEELLAFDD